MTTPEEEGMQPAPVRLTRARILDAAAAIVGAEGVSALTMRRLGAELGADHTALYRHFRSKRDLLGALADRLFATEAEYDPAATWRTNLWAIVDHGLGRYRVHLDLGLLLAGARDDLRGLIQIRERTLELLTQAGLDLPQAAFMSQVIENHVVGCGLFFAVSHWSGPDAEIAVDLEARRRAFAVLPPGVAPLATEAAPHLFPAPDVAFTTATELIFDAIERMAAQTSRGSAGTPEAIACP